MNKKKSGLTLNQKAQITGFLFLVPFLIGFLLFFARPFIQTMSFAFENVKVGAGGYKLEFTGLENFKYIFNVDQNFKTNLISSFTSLLWQVPVILVSSLFIALLLTSNFRGQQFARVVFFLPVIMGNGVIMTTIKQDAVVSSTMSGNVITGGGTVLQSNTLEELLTQAGLDDSLVELFTMISNNIFGILFSTGIQMLLFLAALHGISPSLYEASAIEGATGWDNFWKITIPMIMPIMFMNTVYTIIDSFTSASNVVMTQVMTASNNLQYGVASSILLTYCLMIAVILGLVFALFRKNGAGR